MELIVKRKCVNVNEKCSLYKQTNEMKKKTKHCSLDDMHPQSGVNRIWKVQHS